MADTMARTAAVILCLFGVFAGKFVGADNDDEKGNAISLTSETFHSSMDKNRNFVMFFAPWCGHCKNLAPTWNELAKHYNSQEEPPVIITKVDCTQDKALCADHDVTGFPTIKLFELSGSSHKRYTGKRDLESLKNFIAENLQMEGEEEVAEEGEDSEKPEEMEEGKDALMVLDDETFEAEISEGFAFVKFYAPWCGHCKRLAPTWDELAGSFAKFDEVMIAKIDCTKNPVTCGAHNVRGYPTLLLFKDGKKAGQYQGPRTHEGLKQFVMEQIEAEQQDQAEPTTQPGGENKLPTFEQGEVADLTVDTFDAFLKDQVVFVKFFAPWCGHCKRLAPTWEELAKYFPDGPVAIAKVDCTTNKPICEKNMVRGYPTLKIFRNGEHLADYKGPRGLEELIVFVKENVPEVHDEL